MQGPSCLNRGELKPYVLQLCSMMDRRKVLKWVQLRLGKWLLILLCLNILDILITAPAYEANPFTLYLWGRIGIFLSAWLKIGLVLLFGVLCQVAKMAATPAEWIISQRFLTGISTILVAFYVFVVVWNTILFIRFSHI